MKFLERGTVRDISISQGQLIETPSDPICTPRTDPMSLPLNACRSIAGIDSVSRAGYTPFHLAARRHHYAVCDEMLAAGAHLNAFIKPDLNTDSDVDYTLLVAAANSNELELVRLVSVDVELSF